MMNRLGFIVIRLGSLVLFSPLSVYGFVSRYFTIPQSLAPRQVAVGPGPGSNLGYLLLMDR